jgi:ABC-2 type transport system permease protein
MGDLLSGFILILGSGRIEWYELWAIPVIAFIGGYLFTSIFILFQCLLFWRERWGAFTDRLNDFVLVFSVYPQNIFDGLFRVMLFTVLPAGYIGFLPVELVRRFNWSQFGLYAVGIVGYGVLAVWMFKAGIKRYQGSQKWTR